LVELLLNRRVDIALLYDTAGVNEIYCRPLLAEPLILVMSADLAEKLELMPPVLWETLAEVPLLLPNRRHALRHLIDDALSKVGRSAQISAEIGSISSLRQTIACGLGASVLPLAVVRSFADDASLRVFEFSPAIQ